MRGGRNAKTAALWRSVLLAAQPDGTAAYGCILITHRGLLARATVQRLNRVHVRLQRHHSPRAARSRHCPAPRSCPRTSGQ